MLIVSKGDGAAGLVALNSRPLSKSQRSAVEAKNEPAISS